MSQELTQLPALLWLQGVNDRICCFPEAGGDQGDGADRGLSRP